MELSFGHQLEQGKVIENIGLKTCLLFKMNCSQQTGNIQYLLGQSSKCHLKQQTTQWRCVQNVKLIGSK